MARPKKTGLDYFSLDVDFFSNLKVRKIIKSCGSQAPTILIKLLCDIYKDKGYYIEMDEDWSFLIAAEIGVSEVFVKEVIQKAIEVNFFNKIMANKNILTSNEIQSRWLKVCKDAKRSGCEVNPEYDLIIQEETKLTTEKTQLIQEETKLSTEESTQSKVKESKEEESTLTENEFIEIWKRARLYYDKLPCGFDSLLAFERQNFKSLLNDFTKKQFEYAVAGLFFQETVPAVRVRPDWILKRENFVKMLDCWMNQIKLFEKKKQPLETQKFSKGDI